MNSLLKVLFASCLLLLQSCAAPGTRTDSLDIKQTSRSDVNVALIPAEYREVYFSAGNSTGRHCRAPDPDFTVQQGMSLSLGANTALGASDNVGVGDSQSAMGLGGRAPTVLIARELMYRACELTTNIGADSQSTLDTYAKFMDVIERITDAHLSQGTATSDDSATSDVSATEPDADP